MLELLAEVAEGNARLVGKMVADVPEGKMCWQPGGLVNHPTWTVGHLTFARAGVARVLGRPVEGLSEEWLARFAPGSVPAGEVGVYPGKGEMVEAFGRAQRAVVEALRGGDWEKLAGPNPVERLRDRLPTGRHFVTYLLTVHDGFHGGQIADWRRAMGLPRVM